MKIAFYKGWGSTFFSSIGVIGIKLWTMGKYSHVELIDDDNNWYSSDAFHSGGVRKLVDFKPDEKHWDIFYITPKSPLASDKKTINYIVSQYGKKYDWLGILFSQFLPLGLENPNKWFCSEICHRALSIGLLAIPQLKSKQVSPIKLYKGLYNRGLLTCQSSPH